MFNGISFLSYKSTHTYQNIHDFFMNIDVYTHIIRCKPYNKIAEKNLAFFQGNISWLFLSY